MSVPVSAPMPTGRHWSITVIRAAAMISALCAANRGTSPALPRAETTSQSSIFAFSATFLPVGRMADRNSISSASSCYIRP